MVLDSFLDRTQGRHQSFHGVGEGDLPGVCHVPMEPAFCAKTRQVTLV